MEPEEYNADEVLECQEFDDENVRSPYNRF